MILTILFISLTHSSDEHLLDNMVPQNRLLDNESKPHMLDLTFGRDTHEVLDLSIAHIYKTCEKKFENPHLESTSVSFKFITGRVPADFMSRLCFETVSRSRMRIEYLGTVHPKFDLECDELVFTVRRQVVERRQNCC